jgi:hypothetical protein
MEDGYMQNPTINRTLFKYANNRHNFKLNPTAMLLCAALVFAVYAAMTIMIAIDVSEQQHAKLNAILDTSHQTSL